MARLGVLKPLRGTETSLANVVLEEGEVAFAYPSTGPGTGVGGIKMGDGTSKFSELDWYISGNDSPTPWQYDDGNDEAALLNNIQHCKQETIGKIYYIQSYMNGSSTKHTESTPTIQQDVPYRVIGINHEDTNNTIDLMSCLAVNYLKFNDSYNDWTYGKYTTSKLYNWVGSTCQNGYSANIQANMINMTERWREATGNASGTVQTRSTKVKILNPLELFGSSIERYSGGLGWVYDFTNYEYGKHYSAVFGNNTSSDAGRVRYHDKLMNIKSYYWTNSWYALNTSGYSAYCYLVNDSGSCSISGNVSYPCGIAPVIRLADSSL